MSACLHRSGVPWGARMQSDGGDFRATPDGLCIPQNRTARLLSRPACMPEQIGVLLTPGFSMMSFTPVIEAQRIANRVSGRTLYRWHVLSKNGLPVPASNGIVVSAEASLAEAGRYAHLIVVADNEVRHDDD